MEEFEFIRLDPDADYNQPGARITRGWGMFAGFCAIPAYVVCDAIGKKDCGFVVGESIVMGVLVARDHWFLHKTARFWWTAIAFVLSHAILIAATWNSHLGLDRYSLYPVAALDLYLCGKYIRNSQTASPNAEEEPSDVRIDLRR